MLCTGDSGLSTLDLVLIGVGSLVGLIILTGVAFLVCRMRSSSSSSAGFTPRAKKVDGKQAGAGMEMTDRSGKAADDAETPPDISMVNPMSAARV